MPGISAVGNGGFPEPLVGHGIRLVDSRHEGCGHSTRVRLPSALGAQVVRRVVCEQCAVAYETTRVEDCGIEQELAELTAAMQPPAPEVAEKPEAVAFALPVAAEPPLQAPEIQAPIDEAADDAPVSEPPPSPPPGLPATAPKAALAPDAATAPGPAKPKRKTAVGPELKLPSFKLDRASLPSLGETSWRRLSVPIAGGAVIIGLLLLQGGGGNSGAFSNLPTTAPTAKSAKSNGSPPKNGKRAAKGNSSAKTAQVVAGSNYTLALPKGWDKINPTGGATFAALASDGSADATLWIKRDPKLDFATFEANSLAQLKQLGGSARVVNRQQGPTVAQTVVTLGTNAPKGAPAYQVVLRASGSYFYYLATTTQPGASNEAINGVSLIQDSLLPTGNGG